MRVIEKGGGRLEFVKTCARSNEINFFMERGKHGLRLTIDTTATEWVSGSGRLVLLYNLTARREEHCNKNNAATSAGIIPTFSKTLKDDCGLIACIVFVEFSPIADRFVLFYLYGWVQTVSPRF